MKVSAVIPTRGDVDMTAILQHLRSYPEVDDIWIVVGNSVYNRYRAARAAVHEVIYTQDDDCITDLRPLLDAARRDVIVNAMTREHAAHYQRRATLVGFGAIFDKWLIRVLDDWIHDSVFERECDRVFTALNCCVTLFPKIDILPCAFADNRLYKQSDHAKARAEISDRIYHRTGIVA